MDDGVMKNLLMFVWAVIWLIAGIGLVFYTGEFREYERRHYSYSKMKMNWINSRSYIPMSRFFGFIMIGASIMLMYALFKEVQN
jgi:hypothetical protein